ncbi:retrovirus-related Pol polyprotein from transposon 17.6 [Trichonephila clavipes]|nr:retrovirus-related Pol polyprotein from transposon 17.6 [Trichonephila clavipes]
MKVHPDSPSRQFQGMDGVKVFMDDARITGSDEISQFTALEEFFKKCREHGLKLNLNKTSDASPVGIGCVLSHVYPDGSERPIAFASRTLSGSEKKYSQIDKEALSIVWAVRMFYLYLKGRRFTLITDHKPLIAIFGSKRGLPVLAATRLLHYALILQSFEFDIIFRKTIEHGNADFLSRLPKTSEELEVKDDITIFQMSQIEALPVTSKELRQETSKDIELGPLLRALREEVYPMKVTTTKKTIECLRDSFARFGLPRVLVSDNGSQFTSYEFQRFMHKNGVRHKTSAPFKPSSNGQAERYVATLKLSLRAMHKYEGTIQ